MKSCRTTQNYFTHIVLEGILRRCPRFLLQLSLLFTQLLHQPPAPYQNSDALLPEIYFSFNDVSTILSRLNPYSSMGPDEVHPHFLKSCSNNWFILYGYFFTGPLIQVFYFSCGKNCHLLLFPRKVPIMIY